MPCRLIAFALFAILVTTGFATNISAAVPLYLSSLTISKTAVSGGNGVTGTVTLSSPAPAGGITIPLVSDDSAAVVPATVIIPSGVTSKTFSITTNSVSDSTTADISGSYNGWIQGAELSVLPISLPAGLSFDVSSVQGASGNGCAVVEWSSESAAPVNGYNVYRTSGGTKTLLTVKPFKGNYYPVTGLTNGTTYTYQVAAVDILGQEHALSAPVSATPFSATETLNWINAPSAVTDNFDITVSLSSGEQVFGSFYYIDGVQTGGGYGFNSLINGAQTNIASVQFDSTKLSNGPHVVQFIGFVDSQETIACISPPITIQVSNTISSFHLDGSWFAPQRGDLCYVSATAPAGSTWTVQATSEDGTSVIRTWQGASSLVKLAWDGKDASGNPVTISDYSILLTVQPAGTSPPAIAPSSTKNAQPAPNAGATSTKKRPVKMQAGQPDALALISVGASYSTDSNGLRVPTLAQDIKLSDVLTKACTQPAATQTKHPSAFAEGRFMWD